MHKKSIILAGILLYTYRFSDVSQGLPDLTVTAIPTGAPSFISASEANLPLTATIRNAGDTTSTRLS
jgi:hypothetical protein